MKAVGFFSALIFFMLFSWPVSATEGELVLRKEIMYWVSTLSDTLCDELITVDNGENIPDMRKEHCGLEEGKFSLTLSGPPGTTITLFGKFNFGKENGYLIVRKKDDKGLWLRDLTVFPREQWAATDSTTDSGAFEIFYHASPTFEANVSSVKWGQWWSGDTPR